jgi:hypothetical protein
MILASKPIRERMTLASKSIRERMIDITVKKGGSQAKGLLGRGEDHTSRIGDRFGGKASTASR